ncbi:MAG: TlpA family protein disulfide reductase [Bacteroidales bacterium]
MQKISKILFLFILSTLSLTSQTYNVRIEGHIIGYDGVSEAVYTISPYNLISDHKKVQPDSTGRFTILERINTTHFFYFHQHNKDENEIHHSFKLIVEPNSNYSIVSEGAKSEDWQIPYSPDIYSWDDSASEQPEYFRLDLGQMYYNAFNPSVLGSLFRDQWNLQEPDSLIDKLKERIEYQVAIYNDLLERGEINKKFFEIAKINSEYFNAYQLIQSIQDTWMFSQRYGISDTIIADKLIEIHKEIFEKFPFEDAKLKYFFMPERYIDVYLYYYEATRDGDFSPSPAGGSWEDYLDDIRPLINEEIYKKYAMRYTMSRVASLDLQSLGAARKFLREFPDLQHTYYGELLEHDLIPRLEYFDSLASREMHERVVFLDDHAEVNSFQQLIDSVGNKPLLISFWGTWCSPCRYQFQYNDTLNEFLIKHGIEKVYIAREYRPNRENWKGMIAAFELNGYHFISNEQFRSDLETLGINVRNFPTYMIVNSDGTVVETRAHLPSERELLFQQLEELLNL